MKDKKEISNNPPSSLYLRIKDIIDTAKTHVARSVNNTQVGAYWLIGQEIIQEEQEGKARADYGENIIVDLSDKITKDLGERIL
jgi:hypothetical protein